MENRNLMHFLKRSRGNLTLIPDKMTLSIIYYMQLSTLQLLGQTTQPYLPSQRPSQNISGNMHEINLQERSAVERNRAGAKETWLDSFILSLRSELLHVLEKANHQVFRIFIHINAERHCKSLIRMLVSDSSTHLMSVALG